MLNYSKKDIDIVAAAAFGFISTPSDHQIYNTICNMFEVNREVKVVDAVLF